MCRKTLVFIPKKGPFNQFGDFFFSQRQAATCLLKKGIVRKVRSLSLQLVGRKLRILAVRKTPSFEGQKNLETWTFEGPHLEHSHCLRFKNQPHKLTCNRLQAQTLLGTGSAICFPDLWGCLRKQTSRSRKAGFYNYVCLCLFCLLCFCCALLSLFCLLWLCPAVSPLLANVVAFTCRRNKKKIGVGPEDLARAVYKYLGASHKSYTLKLFE